MPPPDETTGAGMDGKLLATEKLVKEYDIRVGIHNHPRQPNNPNYKVWDPNYILSLVKDRDARLGAAADEERPRGRRRVDVELLALGAILVHFVGGDTGLVAHDGGTIHLPDRIPLAGIAAATENAQPPRLHRNR